jgi:hypothetical protein
MFPLHLLSINHKSTHPYCNVAQKSEIVAWKIERQSWDQIDCILIHSFPSFYTCMAIIQRGAVEEVTVRLKGCQANTRPRWRLPTWQWLPVQCTSDHIWILCCNTLPWVLEHRIELTLFKKSNEKNLKMYITNACAKTPETMWEKWEETIV